MNKKLKTILLLVVFVLFIGAAAWGYNALTARLTDTGNDSLPAEAAPDTEPVTQEEDKNAAPDFTVTDMDGNSVQLSQFKGQPVVLNFWASWCPPCVREMPAFDRVYQEQGEEVVFMMINMTDGQRETREKAIAFVEEEGFTFPIYFDTEQDAADAYVISSIPRTILIDREGNVTYDRAGVMTEESLLEQIELIL